MITGYWEHLRILRSCNPCVAKVMQNILLPCLRTKILGWGDLFLSLLCSKTPTFFVLQVAVEAWKWLFLKPRWEINFLLAAAPHFYPFFFPSKPSWVSWNLKFLLSLMMKPKILSSFCFCLFTPLPLLLCYLALEEVSAENLFKNNNELDDFLAYEEGGFS